MIDGYPSEQQTQPHEQVQKHLRWRSSSYSTSTSGECVEWAAEEKTVRVRDSKWREGPGLTVSRTAWGPFLELLVSPDRDGC